MQAEEKKETERLKFELCYLKRRNHELQKQVRDMGATITRLATEKRALEIKKSLTDLISLFPKKASSDLSVKTEPGRLPL